MVSLFLYSLFEREKNVFKKIEEANTYFEKLERDLDKPFKYWKDLADEILKENRNIQAKKI